MIDVSGSGGILTSARQDGDRLIVAVQGEVDLNNSPELRSALLDLVGRYLPKRLILNLAMVPYMDSSAIAVLVELLRKVGRGGKVVLTDLQPRVKGLLEIARLDTVFVIAKDEAEGGGQ